ncbi:hypothetical protein [Segetibacter aerophilus]|uniref:Uncharacterized protein n=1 Tax=Segetibacter aerophilus TaxID=670293 RepID=A0A512B6N1_9BACT|nr:hypothetical protein [Segetibacter aerophilus]GEO07621.1 hypothetical protein SAE01_01170 [Segetibacter aerophilus]
MLKAFNLQIKKVTSLKAEKRYYESVIRGLEELNKIRIEADETVLNKSIEGLVFSKDRPMQLHALLMSYFKRASNPAAITILFKASNQDFSNAYKQLMNEMGSYAVNFIEESNFYSQVNEWVKTNKAGRIFFLTDDAIILEEFDMNDVLQFNPLSTIFSLTKGTDLTFCFNHNRPQSLPDFKKIPNTNHLDQYFLDWVWEDMPNSPDWAYPLSLDGTFFLKKEMEVLIRNIKFRNPNTFEANLQVFVRAFLPRKGACYPKAKYVNIPCNLVQTEVKNRTTTAYTVEELNRIWNTGKRIDIMKFHLLDAQSAQTMKFEFA